MGTFLGDFSPFYFLDQLKPVKLDIIYISVISQIQCKILVYYKIFMYSFAHATYKSCYKLRCLNNIYYISDIFHGSRLWVSITKFSTKGLVLRWKTETETSISWNICRSGLVVFVNLTLTRISWERECQLKIASIKFAYGHAFGYCLD